VFIWAIVDIRLWFVTPLIFGDVLLAAVWLSALAACGGASADIIRTAAHIRRSHVMFSDDDKAFSLLCVTRFVCRFDMFVLV